MKHRYVPAKCRRIVLFAVLFWLIVGYILYPMAQTLFQSISSGSGYSFSGYIQYFRNPQNRIVIRNTVEVGLMAVLVCGIVGSLLAVYMRFFCTRHRRLIQILLLSPVMIPGVMIVIAFIQLYGESGIITKFLEVLFHLQKAPYTFGGLSGIVFVLAYTQYIFFYLNIYTALQYIDKNMVESVLSFGGGAREVVKDVIFPVVRPAIFISSMTTFVSAISAYSAPSLIGGGFRVLSTQIVKAKANYDMSLASIQVTVLLVIGMLVTLIFYRFSQKYTFEVSTKTEFFQIHWKKRSWLRNLFSILIAIQIFFVLLPIAMIFYLSFIRTNSIMMDIFPHLFTLENYLSIFREPRVLQPMLNSLKMSAMAVAAGLIITLPVAYYEKHTPGKLSRITGALLMLPWSMPASAIAINLINVFNVPSIFAFGQSLIGTFEILPIAYTIVALPLLLNSNQIALGGVSTDVEDASRSLGAGTLKTFGKVVLPNIFSGILAGSILVFVRTVGEYTMSALLYGVYNRPISVSVVTNMQEYHVGISFAYGSLIIALCYFLLWAVLKLDRRRFAVDWKENGQQ